MRNNTIACALILALGLASCGYTFQGSGSVLPSDVREIAIRPVENETPLPGLGPRFAEKLRSRFERYGVVTVVDSAEEADAELIVKITAVDTRVRSVTSGTDIALEYDIFMTISAELRRRSGQLLYRNNRLITVDSYGGVSDVVVTSSAGFAQGGIGADTLGDLGSRQVSRGQEDQAIEQLMDESARMLYMDAVAEEF